MKKIFTNQNLHRFGTSILLFAVLLNTAPLIAQCPQACFGSANTALGEFAGNPNNATGSSNTSVGWSAGGLNSTGNLNAYFGSNAGLFVATGSTNTFLGTAAGHRMTNNSSSNICIGSLSGPSEDTVFSNRMYIDIEGTLEPLIYGEFDNDLVRINGNFEVTAGLVNPSSVHLKEQFSPLSPEVILDKVSQLDIQEWSYKRDPNVRHIGPTAEAFHQAFGLGKDDKTISTIDADGVALIAIQALIEKTEESEQLSRQIESLEQSNKELEANLLKLEKQLGIQ